MNLEALRLRRLIKPNLLMIINGVVSCAIWEAWPYKFAILGVEFHGVLNWTLLLLLSLILFLSSFLVLYIYKFRVVNKALLAINPNFYEEREFGKWFDYYVEQDDKQKKK
jgi:hypothetical protein